MKRLLPIVFLLAACAPKSGAPAAAGTPAPTPASSPADVTPAPTATPSPSATPTPKAQADASATPVPMPQAMSELAPAGGADDTTLPAALIWSSDDPIEGDNVQILSKDGTLQKNKPPAGNADQTLWYAYGIDYWGLARVDIPASTLDPYVGHTVRVEGWYRKIYDHGVWHYSVVPRKITVLK